MKGLLSSDHCTLIEASASMKSSGEPPAQGGGCAEADFYGEKRSNDTHVSTSDADARLYRKGKASRSRSSSGMA
ncbi:hypothetical protein ACVINW_003873 [Bradyrhizobium sp. USDA 4461]